MTGVGAGGTFASLGAVALVVTVVVSAAASGGVLARASDEWPDQCGETTPAVGPGVHRGTLSPGDGDAFRLDVREGASLAVNVTTENLGGLNLTTASGTENRSFVYTTTRGERLNLLRGVEYVRSADAVRIRRNVSFRLYVLAVDDGPPCILLRPIAGNASGNWTVTFERENRGTASESEPRYGDAQPTPHRMTLLSGGTL